MDIKTTLIYTQLLKFKSDEYYSAKVKTTEEANQLKRDFEHVYATLEKIMLFRKRGLLNVPGNP